jgi:hypothetical protein
MPFEVQHQVDLPIETLFRAKLVELEHRKIPYVDKKTKENKEFGKLNWVFEITEQGDFLGRQVRAETNDYLSDSQHNRFGQFARALLRRDLSAGQMLSEGDLIGLSGLIDVRYEKDRNDPDKQWPRVGNVYELDPASSFDEPPF